MESHAKIAGQERPAFQFARFCARLIGNANRLQAERTVVRCPLREFRRSLLPDPTSLNMTEASEKTTFTARTKVRRDLHETAIPRSPLAPRAAHITADDRGQWVSLASRQPYGLQTNSSPKPAQSADFIATSKGAISPAGGGFHRAFGAISRLDRRYAPVEPKPPVPRTVSDSSSVSSNSPWMYGTITS